MKIEVGGFYVFHFERTTIAEVKVLGKDRLIYTVFRLDGSILNENLNRSLVDFKSWVKGRVKRKNPTGK